MSNYGKSIDTLFQSDDETNYGINKESGSKDYENKSLTEEDELNTILPFKFYIITYC